MSKRDSKLLLEDILDSTLKIKQYTAELDFETFLADDKTIDAVVRNFEIIGEAANRLSQEFKDSYPEIEWKFVDSEIESFMIILELIIESSGQL